MHRTNPTYRRRARGAVPRPVAGGSQPPGDHPRPRALPVRARALTLWLLAVVMTALLAVPAYRSAAADAAAPPGLAALYERYVTADGVRYAAWHGHREDRQRLRQTAAFYAGSQPPRDRRGSLAWHLNAYNVWVLELVLQAYPVGGPLEIADDFFQRRSITVAGRRMSLDELEHDIIRPRFNDPRIHFAVNCAAASCPPLHPEPFSGDTLEQTLDRLTRDFINRNPQGVRTTGRRGAEVRLSKIFEWYAEDFGGEDGLIDYVNQYRDQPVRADARVRFLDYDWRLNES